MKPDPGHADIKALRSYVEAVAVLLYVEPSASWSEHSSPSTAYVALADRCPRHADRFLMLQWAEDSGWCLALEPQGAEEPVVLAHWPKPVRPAAVVVARRVRQALAELARPRENATRSRQDCGPKPAADVPERRRNARGSNGRYPPAPTPGVS
ncbi:DUF6292 family protein [Amycolatopsis echigonensis]|uniref:DUF6292 domain-containing protein n=1 Tax=Amycolatopsis echigonensis TaxID=2576905 RepID=A0A8E1VY20_9PSEU|nr:DUF6292 family protein [Amycolatopsis echigonensis]MBB2500455.1 hypothetical protein [Amycolatopsis echigonensis]